MSATDFSVSLHLPVPTQNPTLTPSRSSQVENHILAEVPTEEYALLLPYLEPVKLEAQALLLQPGEPIGYGYFLRSGLASIMVLTHDAKSVEIGVVGKEGFVGYPLIAGIRKSIHRAIVQVPGEAFRIKSDKLAELMPKTPRLEQLLNHYALRRALQVAQVAACNRLHEIEQRLARWLLLTHDRVENDYFPITHEVLAQMLGSGRPSVTVAAGTLQKAGLIGYTRGHVRILNRSGLEHLACECYGIMRELSAPGENGSKHVSAA